MSDKNVFPPEGPNDVGDTADGQPEVDDLLGAYALDAVDIDERDEVDDYLLIHSSARDEVAGYHDVAALLAMSVSQESFEAPTSIWDRISAEIDARPVAQVDTSPPPLLSPASEPLTSPAGSLPTSIPQGAPNPVRIPGGVLAAAAALMVIGGFIAGQFFGGSDSSDPTIAERAATVFADADSRSVDLVSETDASVVVPAAFGADDVGYLDGSLLPDIGDDRTYQLWGVYDDDDVVSLGVLGQDPGIKTFLADEGLTVLVVTEESIGGVTSSENGAVVVGEI